MTETSLEVAHNAVQKINDARDKVLRGEPLTDDELRNTVGGLRADRVSAKPAQKKGKVTKTEPHDMFDLGTGGNDD